jgi:hypothetical protein
MDRFVMHFFNNNAPDQLALYPAFDDLSYSWHYDRIYPAMFRVPERVIAGLPTPPHITSYGLGHRIYQQ